jgi:PGF-pre-PGF domain-containing protein
VNVGGNTHITSVTVTGTGINNLIVTSAEAIGPGTGIQPPPGIINKYMDITPARYTTITSAQISFVVPQSWLVENHLTPQQIVLYHNVGTGWQALPTTFIKNKNDENYYTATSPGFSRYAITGQVNLTAGSQKAIPSPTVLTIGDLAKSSTPPPPTVVTPSLKQTPMLTPMPPVTSTTPLAALDMIPVLGALVLYGAIFLFRKNGN